MPGHGRHARATEMNQALVQDVVSEVMRRLGDRVGRVDGNRATSATPTMPRAVPRAGEDAPANEGKRIESERRPHRADFPNGKFGIFDKVDDAVAAASEAQKKLVKLPLED